MTEKEGNVQKEASVQFKSFAMKLEGLEDGYRVTLQGDPEQIKAQRRVGASFINFVRQADKAGWRIPLLFRLLLKFWGKYNAPNQDRNA